MVWEHCANQEDGVINIDKAIPEAGNNRFLFLFDGSGVIDLFFDEQRNDAPHKAEALDDFWVACEGNYLGGELKPREHPCRKAAVSDTEDLVDAAFLDKAKDNGAHQARVI